MAYDIGPRIGIDGEAEFRRAIQNINTNIKTLGTEMLAVTSAYDANDQSAAALTARNEVLAKQIDAQKEKLAKLQEGLAASAEKYGDQDEKTQRWQQMVNRATAELNRMERQLAENESSLQDVGESTSDASSGTESFADAADQAAGGAERLGRGVGAATVALGNLISSGIQAALSGLKDLASALWNLDESTSEYREAQGKLNAAFEAAGHSGEAAQQAYSDFYKILGDTDTAAEASQLLAQLADSEQDMSRWTNIAAGVAGAFGDALPINSLIEAANETAKTGQVTGALADALNWVSVSEDAFNEQLASCSTESERNRLIMETLSGAYDTAADAFYRNNEAVVQARANQALLDAAMAGLGETVSTVKNRLQAEFLPSIAAAASAFSDLLNGTEGADAAFASAIQGLADTIISVLPDILAVGGDVVMSLLDGVTQNLPTVIESGAGVLLEFINGVVGMLPQIASAALDIIATLASGIADALPELVPTTVDAALQIVETLTDPETLDNLIGAALEIITALADGLVKALPKLAEKAPQIIINIVTALANNLPKITEAALKIIITLAQGLIKAIPQLVKSIPSLVAALVDGFKTYHSKMLDIGKNIVSGVWDGIKAMGSWIKEKVSDFFSGIVDSVKGVLGIHSPSKVFAGIGGYMAEGLGEGFDREIGGVQRRIDRSMKELAGNASASVTVSGGVGTAQPCGGIEDFFARLPALLAEAVHKELEGLGVYLNMRKVGEMTTKWQTDNIRAMGM